MERALEYFILIPRVNPPATYQGRFMRLHYIILRPTMRYHMSGERQNPNSP
ncbi:hypothetical protein GT037_010887 [Alternaria burnsii]|uniref:Uncharacterized protein n=1 Tax=Alternaria burnsii TaxID=1187904 RepID=A0A8H7AV49_9PLEO|nr:uncharacterized protein GT037_010887 [Alternaria burnsii]KAF7671106.1 hypothetical protein GT037_010887 [Alternaria burnsii]